MTDQSKKESIAYYAQGLVHQNLCTLAFHFSVYDTTYRILPIKSQLQKWMWCESVLRGAVVGRQFLARTRTASIFDAAILSAIRGT